MNGKVRLKRLLFRITPEWMWKILLKAYYFSKLKSYLKHETWVMHETDMEIVKFLCLQGDSVIDVGANFGFYTAYLSRLVGETGSVYSFEPIPLTFEILLHNIKSLPLRNVKAFNCAVSNSEGYGVMSIPKWSASGGENFYQARIRRDETVVRDGLRDVTVKLAPLDSSLIDSKKRINFIKIDVEGHELEVVEGARALIARWKPAMLIEISGDPDKQLSGAFSVFETLRSEGYAGYWYDGKKLRLRCAGDQSTNYFFLTNEHLPRLTNSSES